MLEIREITVCFEKRIFDNAEVCFYDGQKHAILGQSGSGKTTLLRLLLGKYDEGEIFYDHHHLTKEEHQNFIFHKMAYVDQQGSYFENMSIFDHFLFYAEMKNERITKEDVIKYLDQVHLFDVPIKKSPSVLSIGEKRRFLIALALYNQKEIIVLDEPLASLDQKSIDILKSVLNELQDVTIIMTTHNMELLDICQYVYKIENCKIVSQKSSSDNIIELNSKDNERRFKPKKYMKFKNKFQWFQQLLLIVIGVFLCLQTASLIRSTYDVYQIIQENSSVSRESFLYFRKRQAPLNMVYLGGGEYESIEISEKEKANIKSIEGVESLYYFDAFLTSTTEEGIVKLFEVERNGQIMESIDGQNGTSIGIIPYYPENALSKENNEVLVNQSFAKEVGVEAGDEISITVNTPTYQYAFEEGANASRNIFNKDITIKIKVDRVLANDESFSYSGALHYIYLPLENFNQILDDNNGQKPSVEMQERYASLVGTEYQRRDYIIFCKEGTLTKVYQEIMEKDEYYDVYAPSLYYIDAVEAELDSQRQQLLISGGMIAIGLLAFVFVIWQNINDRKKERQLLKDIGVNISQIRQSLFLESAVHMVLYLIISMIIIYYLRRDFKSYPYILLVTIILLFTENIISQLIIKKEQKDVSI